MTFWEIFFYRKGISPVIDILMLFGYEVGGISGRPAQPHGSPETLLLECRFSWHNAGVIYDYINVSSYVVIMIDISDLIQERLTLSV